MQRLWKISLAVVLCSIGLARGDDAAEARAIIEKAIRAKGGAENIEKYQGQTFQEKGVYYGMGDGLPFNGNYAVQMPGKFRMDIQGFFALVVNGDKGWVKVNGETRELSKDELRTHHESLHAARVASLVPLVKDKAFVLSLLGESQVGDKPALGVKVTRKGRQDVNLYFDKESGLLVRSEFPTHVNELGGKEVTQETLFSDYKETDGVKHAMKIVINHDGKKYVEAEVSDLKNFEKLDDQEFAKP